MCVRPFAWGGMVLIGVVAFLGITTIRTVRQQQSVRTATIVGPPWAVGDVVHLSDNRSRTMIKPLKPAKLTPRRGEDLQAVIYEKSVDGLGLTKNEAFDDAIEKARAQVTHDLGLSVPVSAEFVRMRLKDDQREEELKNFVKGDPAYRITVDLKMNRGTYLELAEAERSARVTDRSEGVARVLSVVVIALGALAGYIRLDEFTKGYYTGRLRALAVVLVAVATFAISRV